MKKCTGQPEREENMTAAQVIIFVLLIILMFLVTLSAMNYIADKTRNVKVGATEVKGYLTSWGCVGIVLIAVAFDLVSLCIMAHVV